MAESWVSRHRGARYLARCVAFSSPELTLGGSLDDARSVERLAVDAALARPDGTSRSLTTPVADRA
jgi:hypothetical protein